MSGFTSKLLKCERKGSQIHFEIFFDIHSNTEIPGTLTFVGSLPVTFNVKKLGRKNGIPVSYWDFLGQDKVLSLIARLTQWMARN